MREFDSFDDLRRDCVKLVNEKISEVQKQLKSYTDFIASVQKICNHDWQVDDSRYDYHNNIDHETCSICGLKR